MPGQYGPPPLPPLPTTKKKHKNRPAPHDQSVNNDSIHKGGHPSVGDKPYGSHGTHSGG